MFVRAHLPKVAVVRHDVIGQNAAIGCVDSQSQMLDACVHRQNGSRFSALEHHH
jgi:hypothetical protein